MMSLLVNTNKKSEKANNQGHTAISTEKINI